MRQQQASHGTEIAGLKEAIATLKRESREKIAALERESRECSQRNTTLLLNINRLPNALCAALPDTKAVPTGAKNPDGLTLDEFAADVLHHVLLNSRIRSQLNIDPPS